MRRFFLEKQPAASRPAVLEGVQARHAASVLRLAIGARVELFNGSGRAWEAEITDISPGRVDLAVLSERPAPPPPAVRVHLAMALVKPKKMDLAVRMATELGAAGFHPFEAARSVPRPKDPDARGERWQKIAWEAAKQSRNNQAMTVFPLASLAEAEARTRGFALRVLFWENQPAPFSLPMGPESAPGLSGDVLAMVGPEGGFTPVEAKTLLDSGFLPAALGPRILRAETAAAMACGLLQYTLGDLGERGEEG
ncbi:MAG: RsmE family RNA methyltransferase [Pseudomonadota bacterium]